MSFFTGSARKTSLRHTISTPSAPREQADDLPRIILSETGNILFANAPFMAWYDGPYEEMSGIAASNIFEGLELKEGSQKLSFAHNQSRLSLYFDNIQTKQGKTVWVASAQKKTASENLLDYVAEKIEEKQFEQKTKNRLVDFDIQQTIAHYQHTLTRQQTRLSEAEALAHIGQWHWQIGQDRLTFSDQLYKIFGVEPQTFTPTLDTVNAMIHKDDADRMMQVFQRAIIEQKDYDMDFRIQLSADETRYIRCEGRCHTDQEGDVTSLYGIMQDVTETMEREMDLRKAKETAERAYATKSQFLANMSHELRTPLNAVIGFSEMMERQLLGPIGNEKYLEYIKGIRESGEHLLDLISDILDMSKIEAGKYDLSLEKFNISKVIRLAVHMMEGRALDNDIKININLSQEELQIVADRRAVMQMLLNLLSNAVKFSKQSGSVDINLTEQENYFSIIVQDSGIGIPANKLANITMPFEQAQQNYQKEYEGTGLGLSITKELCEIHGGTLHIESQIDEGTSVTIRLPYKATT